MKYVLEYRVPDCWFPSSSIKILASCVSNLQAITLSKLITLNDELAMLFP
jgi:hypothetical protein